MKQWGQERNAASYTRTQDRTANKSKYSCKNKTVYVQSVRRPRSHRLAAMTSRAEHLATLLTLLAPLLDVGPEVDECPRAKYWGSCQDNRNIVNC